MTIEDSDAAETQACGESTAARQVWLSLLARACVAELEQTLLRFSPQPRYEFLRRAEPGMVMLRARMGGTGDPFNLGETSVTRCSVRLSSGHVGTGYVLGRERRKAELVAVFDALLQDPGHRLRLEHSLLEPLRSRLSRQRRDSAIASGSTKVEFFTMVRGE